MAECLARSLLFFTQSITIGFSLIDLVCEGGSNDAEEVFRKNKSNVHCCWHANVLWHVLFC